MHWKILDKNETTNAWEEGRKNEKWNVFFRSLRQARRSINAATIHLSLCPSRKKVLNIMKYIQDDPAHLMS